MPVKEKKEFTLQVIDLVNESFGIKCTLKNCCPIHSSEKCSLGLVSNGRSPNATIQLTTEIKKQIAEFVSEDAEINIYERCRQGWSRDIPFIQHILLHINSEHYHKKIPPFISPQEKQLIDVPSVKVRCQAIEMAIKKNRHLMDSIHFFSLFTHLSLYSKKIAVLDSGVELFTNLTFLSLTGNRIEKVEHLPPFLKYLDLGTNYLKTIPNLEKYPLIHLGLEYNMIESLETHLSSQMDGSLPSPFPKTLASLDLSFNHITDLEGISRLLEKNMKMRTINLQGNPLSLRKIYWKEITNKMKDLEYLDDRQVFRNKTTKDQSTPPQTAAPDEKSDVPPPATAPILRPDATLLVHFQHLSNIVDPNILSTWERNPDEFSFSARFLYPDKTSQFLRLPSNNVTWNVNMNDISFNKAELVVLPATRFVRDWMLGGAEMQLFINSHFYEEESGSEALSKKEARKSSMATLKAAGANQQSTVNVSGKNPGKNAGRGNVANAKNGRKQTLQHGNANLVVQPKLISTAKVDLKAFVHGEKLISTKIAFEAKMIQKLDASLGSQEPAKTNFGTVSMTLSAHIYLNPNSSIVKALTQSPT